ncbi:MULTISPECIES: hypothetical protein [unclassified Nonomuraea]|uniref:hypothetical protein n=1 Tax=unclassified Nonomuraea TaxID=2593643 RepID=UPI0035C19D04
MLGPLSPPWIEPVPPWHAPISAVPPVVAVPPISALPSVTGVPPVTVLPSVSAGPPVSPFPAVEVPRRDRRPDRPLAPPQDRPARPRPQGSPAPQAPPEAPAPERPADPPPSSRGRGMPDPCATFHDFRRQPCYDILGGLTR